MICESERHAGPSCIKKAEKRILVTKGGRSEAYLMCEKHCKETVKELRADHSTRAFKIVVQSL